MADGLGIDSLIEHTYSDYDENDEKEESNYNDDVVGGGGDDRCASDAENNSANAQDPDNLFGTDANATQAFLEPVLGHSATRQVYVV